MMIGTTLLAERLTADEEPAGRELASGHSRLGLGILSAATLLFYLATAGGYGIFRDELYYLACADHLGLGYVDHPPLIGWITAAVRGLLGDSLLGLRFLPAVAAAATVWIAGGLARELGGGRFAQLLAAAATALAPVYLSLFSFLSMNAFDVLVWAVAWWILARILGRGEERLWLAFGAVAGLGLENKISVLFLGFGVAVGLLVSRRWGSFRSRWIWLGGALALLLFLPHLVWQQLHGWPTLEFMENARRFKMAQLSPAAFLREQLLHVGPLGLIPWIAGLAHLLFARKARPFRALGWAFVAILAVMLASGAKPYYLAPAHLLLFAAGGVAIADRSAGFRSVRRFATAVLAAAGLALAPLAKPLLPVDTVARYFAFLGLEPASGERHEMGRLPQFFADMHGWRELAREVADVHRSLPAKERERACVVGQNYGEAGAIDHFGAAYGLPKAISGHNSYHLWGPGGCSGEVVIVIGDRRERLEEIFEEVELVAVFDCRDCMPYEDDQPIWIGRRLRVPIEVLWPEIRRYI